MENKDALLEEVAGILGHQEPSYLEPVAESPAEVVPFLVRETDDPLSHVVLDALSEYSWEDVASIAALGVLEAEELEHLSASLIEGVADFRGAWNEVTEQTSIPDGVGRGAFLAAHSIGPDLDVLEHSIAWSIQLLKEGKMKATLRKAMPKLSYVLFGPKSDKETATTKEYMAPHSAGTDKPDKSKQVMPAPHFIDPDKKKSARTDAMAKVEKQIKKMEKAAEAAGKHPEEMHALARYPSRAGSVLLDADWSARRSRSSGSWAFHYLRYLPEVLAGQGQPGPR